MRDKNKIHYEEKEKKVQLMAILNCTPDSFFEKSRFFSFESAVAAGIKMVEEGADIIDLGGESTRPYSLPVSEQEEIKRVIPVIKELSKIISIPLSIDTSKVRVAEKALEAGARFLNDVTGLSNPEMVALAASAKIPVCVMHMQRTPQDMQTSPSYPEGVVEELLTWFQKKIETLLKAGIEMRNLILDPGIGFGKTVKHNLEILTNLPKLRSLGFPVLIGLSRKSFMGKILEKPTTDLLSTTLALNTMSILEGASIIRVHDVKEHRDVIDLLAFMHS